VGVGGLCAVGVLAAALLMPQALYVGAALPQALGKSTALVVALTELCLGLWLLARTRVRAGAAA
jgi:hypothetical protein